MGLGFESQPDHNNCLLRPASQDSYPTHPLFISTELPVPDGQDVRQSGYCSIRLLRYNLGKGRLNHDDAVERTDDEKAFNDGSKKLVALMGMLNRYLYIVNDPALLALYHNMLNLINEKDSSKACEYIRNQERIFDMISAANDSRSD